MIIVEIFPICDYCNQSYSDTRYKTKQLLINSLKSGKYPWKFIKTPEGVKHKCHDCILKETPGAYHA
jgi:hypothetical protein